MSRKTTKPGESPDRKTTEPRKETAEPRPSAEHARWWVLLLTAITATLIAIVIPTSATAEDPSSVLRIFLDWTVQMAEALAGVW